MRDKLIGTHWKFGFFGTRDTFGDSRNYILSPCLSDEMVKPSATNSQFTVRYDKFKKSMCLRHFLTFTFVGFNRVGLGLSTVTDMNRLRMRGGGCTTYATWNEAWKKVNQCTLPPAPHPFREYVLYFDSKLRYTAPCNEMTK